MKRKIAILLVGMMCVSASGCSMFNKSGIDMTTISVENPIDSLGEEAVVEGSEAAEAFTTAMTAVGDSTDITINVENSIIMGTEGEADFQNSISKSLIKIAKDGDIQKGNVEINNTYKSGGEAVSGESAEPTEETNNISGYYDGSSLYFITNDGDKVQEEMGYEDFLSVVNTYSLSIYNDCISKAACVESNNGKTYYITYDPSAFETTMNTNMEASGQTMADGEAMHVIYANIVAQFDKDDNLTGYGFIINAEYVSDTGSIPYNYSIKAEFSDMDSTKVDEVEDLDSYMTADEYTQKMQEEANGTSGAEDTGSADAEGQVSDDADAAENTEAGTDAQ